MLDVRYGLDVQYDEVRPRIACETRGSLQLQDSQANETHVFARKSEDPKWYATSLCPLLKVCIVLNIIKDNNAMAV